MTKLILILYLFSSFFLSSFFATNVLISHLKNPLHSCWKLLTCRCTWEELNLKYIRALFWNSIAKTLRKNSVGNNIRKSPSKQSTPFYVPKTKGGKLELKKCVKNCDWAMTTLVSQEPGLATIPESPTGENHVLPRQASAAAAAA